MRVLIARTLCGHTDVLHTDLSRDILVVTPEGLVGDLLGTYIDELYVTNLLEIFHKTYNETDSQPMTYIYIFISKSTALLQ